MMNKQFKLQLSENNDSIIHQGTLIAQLKKNSILSAFHLNLSKKQQSNQYKKQNCSNQSIKLKSVCKNYNISNNKEQIYFDYLLLVYQSKHDNVQFKEYVNQLKSNKSVYNSSMLIVKNIEDFGEIVRQKIKENSHRRLCLLTGQYSIVNYKPIFKQINQILVFIDNQQKYSSLSYLLKQPNVKALLYDLATTDEFLKNINIVQSDTKYQFLPSKICLNKAQSSTITQKFNSTSNTFKSCPNKQNKQSIDLSPQCASKINSNFLPVQSAKERFTINKQKSSLNSYQPRQSIFSKSNKENISQNRVTFELLNENTCPQPILTTLSKNITFGKQEPKPNSMIQNQKRNQILLSLDSECLSTKNHSEFSDYQSEIRKVSMQPAQQKLQEIQANQTEKSKHKYSHSRYKNYMRAKINKKMKERKQGTKFDLTKKYQYTKTASTQFYKKREIIIEQSAQYQSSQHIFQNGFQQNDNFNKKIQQIQTLSVNQIKSSNIFKQSI